jgi:hypothetical protein
MDVISYQFLVYPSASWIPILLCVKIVGVFVAFDNIFSLMVKALLDCWWIKVERIVSQINQYVV